MRRAILAAGALALFAGCGKRRPPETDLFWNLRAVTAYVAMMECSSATNAVLAGDAGTYGEFFSRRGLALLDAKGDGRAGIVCLRGEPPRGGWRKLDARLADGGVAVWCFSVKGLAARRFRKMLESFPYADTHLWIPGAEEWMLVGRREPTDVGLVGMLDVFADERCFDDLVRAKCDTMPRMFASYAATRQELTPAFDAGDGSVVVKPQFFLPEGTNRVVWIDSAGVDPDIAAIVEAEIATNQAARRVALRGNMLSEAGEAEKAIETWAEACRMNPTDPLITERIDRLDVNAHAFYRVGNLAAATKCYETMVLIDPENAGAVRRLGICYRQLGKGELGAEVIRKAEMLSVKKYESSALRWTSDR